MSNYVGRDQDGGTEHHQPDREGDDGKAHHLTDIEFCEITNEPMKVKNGSLYCVAPLTTAQRHSSVAVTMYVAHHCTIAQNTSVP